MSLACRSRTQTDEQHLSRSRLRSHHAGVGQASGRRPAVLQCGSRGGLYGNRFAGSPPAQLSHAPTRAASADQRAGRRCQLWRRCSDEAAFLRADNGPLRSRLGRDRRHWRARAPLLWARQACAARARSRCVFTALARPSAKHATRAPTFPQGSAASRLTFARALRRVAGKSASGLKEVTDSFAEGIAEGNTGISKDGGANAIKSADAETVSMPVEAKQEDAA